MCGIEGPREPWVLPGDLRMAKRRRALVLLSGGIDSAACTQFLLEQDYVVGALFADYGQPAAEQERNSASLVASHFGIPLSWCTVAPRRTFGAGEIPGRNAWLVLTAYMLGEVAGGVIALGVHAGSPYYDCTEAFLFSLNRLLGEHSDGRVCCYAPFVSWPKALVYRYFKERNLPLALTYSCEAGTVPPCGICRSCLDRGNFDAACQI